MGTFGAYKTKPRGMVRSPSLARIRAAISRSERSLWIVVAMLRGRFLRRLVVWDLDWVTMDADEEDAEDVERLDVDIHARAHLEIACSKPADIAPRRPPKTDALELELELDEDEDEGAGDADLGGSGVGGLPR